MAQQIEALYAQLEVRMSKYEKDMQRANRITAQNTRDMEKSFSSMNSRVSQLMSSTASTIGQGVGQIAAIAGAALSVGNIIGYADAWQAAANKIAAAGESASNVGRRLDQLTNIALASRTGLEATVDLYAGLVRSTEGLGLSQNQLLKITENVNKAFVVGGQGASAQAAGVLQLSQALQSGTLQGDELRSLRENAPLLAKAIADSLGVPIGKLKELGEEGKLTADVVTKALLKMGSTVEAQFARTIPTVEQALASLKTSITRYIGQQDQASGASQKLAQGILALSRNVDVLLPIAAALGALLLAAFSPAVAGIAAAGAALVYFGSEIEPILGHIRTFGSEAAIAFQVARDMGGEAWQAISAAVTSASETISSVLAGIPVSGGDAFGALLGVVKGVINAVIGSFVFAVETIKATWNTLGFAMAEAIVNAMNAVIAAVEAGVSRVVGAINGITSFAGLGTISAPDLGRITNSYAGAGQAAAKAYGEAFGALTRDYVGDAIAGAEGALQRIKDRMDAIRSRRDIARFRQSELQSQNNDDAPGPVEKRKPDGGDGGGAKSQNEFERELANLEKRIVALGREREAIGLSTFEAAKAEAAYKLLDAAKAAGIPITEELRQKIDQLSAAFASEKVATDQRKQDFEAMNELARFAGQNISSFYSDIISGGKNAEKAVMNLTKRLADAAFQAFLLGEGALGKIFGLAGSGGRVGGLLGALFGSFSGKPPGLALGGATRAGMPYEVGENGREIFMPTQPGRIIPNSALRSGGGNSVRIQSTFDLRGSNLSPGEVAGMIERSNMQLRQQIEADFARRPNYLGSRM